MKNLCKKMLSINLALFLCVLLLANSSPAHAAETYEIMYYGSGGRTDTGDNVYWQTVDSLDSVRTMGSSLFTYSGYQFLGWEDSQGSLYFEDRVYDLSSLASSRITLRAVWGYARVIYHGNGGVLDGSKDAEVLQPVDYQGSERFKGDLGFTYEDHVFVGWNTSPSGTGVWYSSEQTVRIPGTIHLYAQWREVPHRYLCLDANGTGIFGEDSAQYIPLEEFPTTYRLPELPDSPGRIPVGWSTVSAHYAGNQEKELSYAPGTELRLTENTTLYAWYVPNTIFDYPSILTIYNGNGGANAVGSTVKENASSWGNLTLYGVDAFSKEGAYLSGWNTSPDGTGTGYELYQELPLSEYEGKTLRLYARWSQGSGKYLLYSGNGGTTADGKTYYIQSVDSYEDVSLAGPDTFSRPGEEFIGWKDADGNWYYENETYSFDGQTTLTAQWGYARVTYHGNGGVNKDSKETQAQYVTNSSATFLTSSTFTKAGCAFVGWNTEADGSGVWYPVAGKIGKLGILDLYAQWEEVPANYLSLDANGSDIFNGRSFRYIPLGEYPTACRLPEMTDSPEYTYIGWSSVAAHYSGSQEKELNCAPGTELRLTENLTLYAWYISNTAYDRPSILAIYDGNGGANAVGSTVKRNSTSYGNLTLYGTEAFSKEDAYLSGWNTNPDGSGTGYELCQVLPASEYEGKTLRLYAQWTEGSGKYLLYGGNGGTTADGKTYYIQSVDSYGDVTLAGPDTFSRPGWEFIGWKDADGNWYYENETYSFGEQPTLTAQWGYARITYHGNGGLSWWYNRETQVQYVTNNYTSFLSASDFIRTGYVFVGWNTEADGSGTWYPASGKIGKLGILDLYAQWEKVPAKYLCLDARGSDALNGRLIQYIPLDGFPATYRLPEMTDSADHTFIGWGTTSSAQSGAQCYAPGTDLKVTKNTTLYAWYVPANHYSVYAIFDGNGGADASGSTAKYRVTIDPASSGDLRLYGANAFTREGYELVSWNTERDGSGKTYAFNEELPFWTYRRQTLRLYAQWKFDPLAEHTLVFDPITPTPNTVLRVGVYDEMGKMICLTEAGIVNGRPQASILCTDYAKMYQAKLFQLDGTNYQAEAAHQTITKP